MSKACMTSILLLTLLSSVAAEERVQVIFYPEQRVARQARTGLSIETYDLLHPDYPIHRKLALAQTAATPADPEAARESLTKAVSNLRRYVSFGDVPVQQVRTLKIGDEDIVTCKLPAGAGVAKPAPVLLWSDAAGDTIIFRTPVDVLRSPNSIRAFFEQRLVLSGRQMRAFLFAHSLSESVPFHGWSKEGGVIVPRQFELAGYDAFYTAEVIAGFGYVSVRSRNEEQFERFPPFASRVPAMTTPQLLKELHRDEQLRAADSMNRKN